MKIVRSVAERFGLYHQVRYSRAYEWYARLFHPTYAAGLAHDKHFYSELFRSFMVRRVFDFGANDGDKAHLFRQLADQVVCVEADPDLAEVLWYRFQSCRNVKLEIAAVGETSGTATLYRKKYSGYNTLSVKWSDHVASRAVPARDAIQVSVVTADQLIAAHGLPDYIKIDVEGHELPVLNGLTQPVSVLSFESNLPAFRQETLQVIDRLLALDERSIFNARAVNEPTFVLAEAVGREEIQQLIGSGKEETFDIFCFSAMKSGAPKS